MMYRYQIILQFTLIEQIKHKNKKNKNIDVLKFQIFYTALQHVDAVEIPTRNTSDFVMLIDALFSPLFSNFS